MNLENTTNMVFRSRNIILDMLEHRGYSVDEYRNFTFDTITTMFRTYSATKDLPTCGSLDILIKGDNKPTIFVKYNLEKFRQTAMQPMLSLLGDRGSCKSDLHRRSISNPPLHIPSART